MNKSIENTVAPLIASTPKKRGRKPLPADKRRSHTARARLRADEQSAWRELGGARWLQRQLANYLKERNKTLSLDVTAAA